MILYQTYSHIEILPSQLIPVKPDGQEQLPSTHVPPFEQEKSVGQTKQQNKWCLQHNKSSQKEYSITQKGP